MKSCELCAQPGGDVLWQGDRLRVVLVGGAEAEAFPGFCRVIWTAHVAEMTDLQGEEAAELMWAVFATERAVRATLQPDKINLASLGNVVPHVHWHVIPRWRDDSHFPRPIWGTALREVKPRFADGQPWRAALIEHLLKELSQS